MKTNRATRCPLPKGWASGRGPRWYASETPWRRSPASGTLLAVDQESHILTAAELDAMTPDERRAEFRRRVVRDVADLPDDLRERIRSTAETLARGRSSQ